MHRDGQAFELPTLPSPIAHIKHEEIPTEWTCEKCGKPMVRFDQAPPRR